jgi:hypothetical protein
MGNDEIPLAHHTDGRTCRGEARRRHAFAGANEASMQQPNEDLLRSGMHRVCHCRVCEEKVDAEVRMTIG